MSKFINLVTGEGGYRLKTPVVPGNTLLWHGTKVDPFACPEHLAKKMAEDPKTRYVTKVSGAASVPTPSAGSPAKA